MTILLVGGGSGGHITPLLAVARELKALDPAISLVGVCETDAKFIHLFEEEPAIDKVYQVQAGKYRRYAGLSRLQRMLNVPTFAKNVQDVGRVVKGYAEARKLLKKLRPDGILIKGGFVGVPVGLAAAHLDIPFITHDSDSTPGLANKIIAKWARKHATGMPIEYYSYPPGSMVYTGVPIASQFSMVSAEQQAIYRTEVGLEGCKQVVMVIGGSQGGQQLNDDIVGNIGRLMQKYRELGLIHVVGMAHEHNMQQRYAQELLTDERRRVIIKSFVPDVFRYMGAADVVVSRASATVIAELAAQGKAVVLVPGQLAGDHQSINARHLVNSGMAVQVDHADREGLYMAIDKLLSESHGRAALAVKIRELSKPSAAQDLAKLLLSEFRVVLPNAH